MWVKCWHVIYIGDMPYYFSEIITFLVYGWWVQRVVAIPGIWHVLVRPSAFKAEISIPGPVFNSLTVLILIAHFLTFLEGNTFLSVIAILKGWIVRILTDTLITSLVIPSWNCKIICSIMPRKTFFYRLIWVEIYIFQVCSG